MTYIIEISGASGSGKSTFTGALKELLEKNGLRCAVFAADAYFKNPLPTMISPADGETYSDWNHPTSFDSEKLAEDIIKAKNSGEYDYILTEGVTIFCVPEIRDLADCRVFIDAEIETRIFRRIARNVVTKGQTIEFIGGYYLKCARHREKEFCLPSAKYAHIRVDNEYGFDAEKEWKKIEEMLTK